MLLLASPRRLRGLTRFELTSSAWVGLAMIAGFSLQTIGLLTIESSKSAFISALYVPLVPIITLVFLRERPRRVVWIGIVIAFVGLVLLAGPAAIASLTLGRGEIATFISSIAFAAQIVLMGRFAGRVDAGRASLVQVALLSIASFAMMPLAGEAIPSFSWPLVATAGGLGIASALIQVIMNWAQAFVSANRAALIYAVEPVWAGLLGRFVGERLPGLAILGGAMVIVAVIVSEARWPRRAKVKPVTPA